MNRPRVQCPHCHRPWSDGTPTVTVDAMEPRTSYNAKSIATHTRDVPVKVTWHASCHAEFAQYVDEVRAEAREQRVQDILLIARESGIDVNEAEVRANLGATA